MKLVRLLVENVKRVQSVEIEFGTDNVVVVGGRNAQGKSSVLDALEMALAGKKSIPAEPIRRGQSKARVVVETDQYTITRTFTEKASNLTVASKEGAKFSSPQAMLDKVICDLSFDPLSFLRKSPKEQAETVRALVGLDFSALDRARQSAYDERTIVNREVKALESQIGDGIIEQVEPVSVAELLQERDRRQAANKAVEEKRSALETAEQRRRMTEKRITDLREEIESIQEQIGKEMDALAAQTDLVTQSREEVSGLAYLDVEEITEKISKAESINAKAAQYQKRKEIVAQLAGKKDEAAHLTAKIETIEKEKSESLAEANMPVPGMAFDENGITVDGIPFEQRSSAEKLRVSVAMGLALHPDLKLIQIRDGSLLDEDSMKMLCDMAREADAQVMVEKVTSTGEGCTVVIEDGMVKSAEKEEAA